MARIFDDNSRSIGGTPLVHLKHIGAGTKARILAKLEGRNPAYSVKDRIGASMIWDAEERGVLKPGVEVVEPTSGNTGIALGFVCASRGYALTLTMPETMSLERRKVLAAFGAKLVLTPGPEGMTGAIRKAEGIVASDPARFFMPQQFRNPANPAIHERTTGPEIWADTDGAIDVLVSGAGTGGTITGVGQALRARRADVALIAVEPANSAVLSGGPAGPHRIQGIGAGFVPEILDRALLTEVRRVTEEEAEATMSSAFRIAPVMPSGPGVRTSFAPNAASTFRRSRLIVSGMVSMRA